MAVLKAKKKLKSVAKPSQRAARPSTPRPKKTATKKTTTKKAAAKKTAAKKTTAKKTTARKTTTQHAVEEAPPSSSPADVRASRIEALRHVFTALGARHPDRWARSHVQDGVDQIGRFVFLRALWGRVVKDGRFLDKMRKNKSELTPVVERLVLAGAEEGDVIALVRALQVGLLVDLCQLLDDPADNDEGVRWGLWRMDKRGLPLWQLGDLRLDVLDVDPADDL